MEVMSSMGILAQTAKDNGWTAEDCGSCLTLTRDQEQIVVTCGATGRITGVTVRQPEGSYSIMTGPGKRGRVMEILDAKPEVAACPEEQPRALEQIADSVWALAGPHFEHMSPHQARMVERLVREAYERGYADDQRRRCLNCGKTVAADNEGRLAATDPRDEQPWRCEYNGGEDHLPTRRPYLPPKYKIRKKS